MGVNISTKGYYFGYTSKLVFKGAKYHLTIHDTGNIQTEVNSNDNTNPAESTFTVFNIERNKTNQIKKGDHIYFYTGPSDLYGLEFEGEITKIQANNDDGRDHSVVYTAVESENLNNTKFKANFNGVSTVRTKGKHPKSKLNMTFRSGTHASTILRRLARASGIHIYHIRLARDKIYKRGYSVSNYPYKAMVKIAKDCKSQIYQRRGKVVIDDFKTDNPYNEHIYLTFGAGLVSEPSITDDSGKRRCFTLECFDDPRIQAGSCVQVKSKYVNGLHRVQSVKHTHDSASYDMEVIIYA